MSFTDSLVHNTDPNPYNQLIVQSQKMINDAFYNMWAIADTGSPLLSLDVTVSDVGELKGDLDAPSASLHVTSSTPQLYFFVTFTSGTLTLDTNKSWDVTGWKFSFPVNIGTVVLNSGDPGYDDYKTKMGITDGDFSLAQLYIDASQATELDMDRSSFGTEVWSSETDTIQQDFKDFVQGWITQMADGDKTIIGVALQTSNPSSVNSVAPTFPPTSLDETMYPWIDPSSPGQATDDLDANALCYLMMTGNVSPPSPPSLPYSGTWVNDQDNNQGVLCMNSSQFWDQWLLPLVQVVNAATEVYPTTPYLDANWDGSGAVAPELYVGYNPDHTDSSDSYFSFGASGVNTWTWTGDSQSSHNDASADLGSWWNELEAWENTNSSSSLQFDQGGQQISFTGVSTFEFTVKQSGVVSGPYKTEATFTITTNWHLNFALGVVSDGGLQIALIPDPEGTSACTSTGESQTEGIDWDIDWDTYTNYISSTINDTFSSNLGEVENDLLEALADQHKLFLPASGTFLMEDAMFNDRGDLLATLHYNGAPPPGQDAKMPAYLAKLPKRLAKRPVVPRKKPHGPFRGPLMKIPAKEAVPVGGVPPKVAGKGK
ncbi:hypothetical protein JAAARDRAFT_183032 [Jaapia argillacea MUCL 33604]|uniref:Uncharacterized protein n=1 Tax=Jaapia argillacea MUCL 33604 TaxID=933084 RepID=A0A067PI64_9AGAM|nr:hypothetical protein JAAARDRAFT_183032 [Jaapia argillacea MUCL 33604]